ncbi:hypothetical protein BDV18DRAFT_145399 [Aspergillus unguis]
MYFVLRRRSHMPLSNYRVHIDPSFSETEYPSPAEAMPNCRSINPNFRSQASREQERVWKPKPDNSTTNPPLSSVRFSSHSN